jgi:ankyrin repeat protein
MQAALENHPATVKLLAKLGAEVDARDSSGKTALANAALDQHTKTVAALLECVADVDAADKWGGTALHVAARRGNRDIVRMLVEAKADIGLRESSGRTPWIVAVHSNKAAGLKELLEPDPEKERYLRELQRDKHAGDIAKHMNMIYR